MRWFATVIINWSCCLAANAQYDPRTYLLSDAMKQAEAASEHLAMARLDECLGDNRSSELGTAHKPDSLDWRLDRFLLALSDEDTNVRQVGTATGYQIDSVDRSVWLRMLAEIESNGFPNRQSISSQARGGLVAIVWHNVRKSPEAWDNFQPTFEKALGDLNIHPWEYAQMIDAYRYRYMKQAQVYNTFVNELASENTAGVNRSRLEIGLRPEGWTVEEILGIVGVIEQRFIFDLRENKNVNCG